MELTADKFLAEQKCRQDTSCQLPDSVGTWLQNEAHILEHRPWLNNVSTSIKRSMIDVAVSTVLLDPAAAGISLFPQQAGGMEPFYAQPFVEEVMDWWDRRARLDATVLRVPKDPANNNLPYDFLEYVPLLSHDNLDTRYERLNSTIEYRANLLEACIPRRRISLLQGRDPDEAQRHEKFCGETLDFIHGLLAIDPGLGSSRMADLASLFASIVLDPWIQTAGIFNNPAMANRAQLIPNEGAVSRNTDIRDLLHSVMKAFEFSGMQLTDAFWPNISYSSSRESLMLNSSPTMFRDRSPKLHDAQNAAVFRWMEFYRIYLQVIADATAGESHTKIEETHYPGLVAQGNLAAGCVVCGTDWADTNYDYNYPIHFQPCGMKHAICMGCFKQISLQPAALGGRKCPLCRMDILYPLRTMTLRSNLSRELALPALTPVIM